MNQRFKSGGVIYRKIIRFYQRVGYFFKPLFSICVKSLNLDALNREFYYKVGSRIKHGGKIGHVT